MKPCIFIFSSRFDLKSLKPNQFDVILIEPPLEEYARTCGVTNVKFWDWDKIMALDIGELAAQRSFVFLWCGSSDGLDLGRLCLQNWGLEGKRELQPCVMGKVAVAKRSSAGQAV